MTSSKLFSKNGEGHCDGLFHMSEGHGHRAPDIWLSIIVLGVPDGVYVAIGRLSKAVYPL